MAYADKKLRVVSIEGHIYGQCYSWEPDKVDYSFSAHTPEIMLGQTEMFYVGPHTLTFTWPEGRSIIESQLESLQAQERKLQEEFGKKFFLLQEAKKQLQQLSYVANEGEPEVLPPETPEPTAEDLAGMAEHAGIEVPEGTCQSFIPF